MKVNKNAVHDGVQDVLDWLHKVRYIDELINSKLAERDQLMDLATKCTPSMDGMPHGGGTSDKVGNIAAKLVDMAKEIDNLIDAYVDFKQEVIRALEKLPDVEYLVMHKHYIDGMSWGDVANVMGYSQVHIWRIKVKALKSLKRAM